MKQKIADKNLVAYCGLYCGSCKKYLLEKCPGCAQNEKATWCKIRSCCMKDKYFSCADCQKHKQIADCKNFKSFISKFFSLLFNSDRVACVDMIKKIGRENYAEEMSKREDMTIKRWRKDKK